MTSVKGTMFENRPLMALALMAYGTGPCPSYTDYAWGPTFQY